MVASAEGLGSCAPGSRWAFAHERRASPVKSPGNVPPSPIFAWIPRFTRYSRRYDADGPAAPDAAEEVKEERSE